MSPALEVNAYTNRALPDLVNGRMPRSILHVDMDAFYASVEQRDDPSLRGKPVIVGGHPRRGVVLAASYEVRPFGVRSAIPMAQAIRLAPRAIVVPPRFHAYVDASEKIHAIFESFTPLVEPLSLDEAFLDVSASTSLFGAPSAIAREIRARIASEVGLPSSAGVAEVKFAAKIGSDLAKPNGQREIPPGETARFLAPLPVSRLIGVGPKTEAKITLLGMRTIGDIAARSPSDLERLLGSFGLELHALANGRDDRPVVPDREAKSIGAEDTFEEDFFGEEALTAPIHSQASRVGRRLRRAGVMARAVVLKLKYADFKVITRRTTLPSPTDDGLAIHRAATALLRAAPLDRPVRLTGVSAHDLAASEGQLGLFEAANTAKARCLNTVLDKIADRFGSHAVLTADLAESEPPSDKDEARRRVGAARFDRTKGRPQGG